MNRSTSAIIVVAVIVAALPSLAIADAVSTVATATMSTPPNTSTVVSLPFGDWINAIAPTVIEIAGAVLTVALAWTSRLLPAALQSFITDNIRKQAEQLLVRAIDYGVNAVAGASVGKTLSVDVGNKVIAEALNYVVTHGPAWIITWMGGAALIEQKIIARLPLEAASAVAVTGVTGAIAIGATGPLVG